MHRYEVQAAAKIISGSSIEYGILASSGNIPEIIQISFELQDSALRLLLSTLSVDYLQIPREIASKMRPLDFGYETNPIGGPIDSIHSRLLMNEYDAVACIESQVQLIFQNLFEIKRIERLVTANSRAASKGKVFTLDYMLNQTSSFLLKNVDEQPFDNSGFLERTVPLYMYVNELLSISSEELLSVTPRAIVDRHLKDLVQNFKERYEILIASTHGDGNSDSSNYSGRWRRDSSSLYQYLMNQRTPFMSKVIVSQGPPI